MLKTLEKGTHRVEIIQSPGHGLIRFRYSGQIVNCLDFYTNALAKAQGFLNKGRKEVEVRKLKIDFSFLIFV